MLVIIWALRPLPRDRVEIPGLSSSQQSAPLAKVEPAVDLSAFEVVLWHEPEPATPVETVPAPQPSARAMSVLAEATSRFELIAIIRAVDGTPSRASLYDRTEDRLRSLGAGEDLMEGVRLDRVHASGVVLAAGEQTTSLDLIMAPKLSRRSANGDRP